MDLTVNYLAVLCATIAAFIVGAIWYMPLFGKLWGDIHGFEKYSKAQQKEMQKGMLPLLVAQFLVGAVTAYVLALVIAALPGQSPYLLTFWMWFGFVIPVQVSGVIFGGTEPKWVVKKTLIQAGGALTTLMASAWVLDMFV